MTREEIKEIFGDEPVDFLVNEKPLAYGEVMVLDEKFGIRISEILTKEQLVEKFKDGLYG